MFPSSSDPPFHHRSRRFHSTDVTPAVTLFPHFPSSLCSCSSTASSFSPPPPPPPPSPLSPPSSLAAPAASFLPLLPLPPQRNRGRNILDVSPRGIEGGYLHTNDNWWVSVSRFGREVSPGPPTRRSETTTTTTRRPLAVTHCVLPSSGVPTYSGYQRTDRLNEASVDAAHPNGQDLSARKTHAQHLATLSQATEFRLTNTFAVCRLLYTCRCILAPRVYLSHSSLLTPFASFVLCSSKTAYRFIFTFTEEYLLLLEDKLFTRTSPILVSQSQLIYYYFSFSLMERYLFIY